jgi:hypothetical protein
MSSRRIAILSLVLIPAVAFAQRGGAGGGFGGGRAGRTEDWNRIDKDNAGALQLSNKDLENISPIKLLIDKRKDLKLTDQQQKQLKDADDALKTRNQPLFKALDSLRAELKRPATSDDARPLTTRGEVTRVVGEVRANYEAALKDALALLDEGQQKTATELVGKQNEDAEKMLSEKLGGRGGGMGRGGRPPLL